jgi:L-Ala-D/L-Glu epimerase
VQITKVEVDLIELKLRHPVQMAGMPLIDHLAAIFVHLITRQGQSAWGCTIAHPKLTGENPEDVLRACLEGAALVPDLHPTNIEYSLNELTLRTKPSPAALCAFDLAFHDLLGLAAGMPLYRILGGYRNRIQTSVTIPISPVDESVELSRAMAGRGFRKLKIKGGIDAAEDVRRVKAIHTALPEHILDLDADGGYTLQDALEVARALGSIIEMFEQPTPPGDLMALRQLKAASPVPILADQSLHGMASALEMASNHIVDGLSIKLVSCGGLRCGRQIDAIARAARLATMVSCFIEPALLVSAGLSLALSSPNVHFGDLDGSFDLANDPSRAGFTVEDGWLVASEVPGLGYSVQLG